MAGVADIISFGALPDRAKVLCLFVHGRNQSPEGMVVSVIRRLSVPDVAFALPRAGAGTWYGARAVDPLTAATRSELAISLDGLAAALAELRAAGYTEAAVIGTVRS